MDLRARQASGEARPVSEANVTATEPAAKSPKNVSLSALAVLLEFLKCVKNKLRVGAGGTHQIE
jgi:hypothetical protein